MTVIRVRPSNANPGYQAQSTCPGRARCSAGLRQVERRRRGVGGRRPPHDAALRRRPGRLVGRTTGASPPCRTRRAATSGTRSTTAPGQFTVRLPKDVSVIVVGDGSPPHRTTSPSPGRARPRRPTVGPLLVAGGVFWSAAWSCSCGPSAPAPWAWFRVVAAAVRGHRACGPRVAPQRPAPRSRHAAVRASSVRGRPGAPRQRARPRGVFVGLRAAGWFGRAPTPTASATGAATQSEPTAATKQQDQPHRRPVAAVAKSRPTRRATHASPVVGFTGAALELREANYNDPCQGLRTSDAPPAISAEQVCVALRSRPTPGRARCSPSSPRTATRSPPRRR